MRRGVDIILELAELVTNQLIGLHMEQVYKIL